MLSVVLGDVSPAAPRDVGKKSGACGHAVIVLDLDGTGFHFSGLENAVAFDIDADGDLETVAWTRPGSKTAFLAMDRDGNGTIDNAAELFGAMTDLATGELPPEGSSGYLALAEYDNADAGGNQNGYIDAGDPIWPRLRIWIDANHNGLSERGELLAMAVVGITRIDRDFQLDYKSDRRGNLLRLSGKAWKLSEVGKEHEIRVYDVCLNVAR